MRPDEGVRRRCTARDAGRRSSWRVSAGDSVAVLRLRELRKADPLGAVWRRIRLAYYEVAEQQLHRAIARSLTADEPLASHGSDTMAS